ncbi:MAG: type IV pilin protein [Pseudomonadota bacterium]|nr:type IV pilin protein [Pseudomonadota bacterium]
MDKVKGFSLLELLAALAIIAVLSAVAIPTYQGYRIHGNRVDVQTEMLQMSQRLENHKLARGTYADIDTLYGSTTFPKTGEVLYNINLTTIPEAPAAGELITGWTLQATPVSNSLQKDDGVVRINHLGQRCWEKKATTCVLDASSNWDKK